MSYNIFLGIKSGKYREQPVDRKGLCAECYAILSDKSKESGKSIDELLHQYVSDVERKLRSLQY